MILLEERFLDFHQLPSQEYLKVQVQHTFEVFSLNQQGIYICCPLKSINYENKKQLN